MDSIERLNPFGGLPIPVQILFAVALLLSLIQLALVLGLSIRGGREQRRAPGSADGSQFLWVFLVPALDEEVTIADTIARLEQVRVTHRRIVVINDGSSGSRPARSWRRIRTRRPPACSPESRPSARKGKALQPSTRRRPLCQGRASPPSCGTSSAKERTLVVIVDADGRLDSGPGRRRGQSVPRRVRSAGSSSAVRIYNRATPLAYMQDVEFRVFGAVFQMGRSAWGTAGMGGNGQVNRLAALTAIAEQNIASGDADGPWRHRLTEDQDLGLSLFQTGWLGQQEMRHAVDQQGLSSYRRLFRQRVRWCQGNMQAIARIGVFRSRQAAYGRTPGRRLLAAPADRAVGDRGHHADRGGPRWCCTRTSSSRAGGRSGSSHCWCSPSGDSDRRVPR